MHACLAVQNDMMKAALLVLPSVRVLASEEDDEVVRNNSSDSGGGSADHAGNSGFAVVFDPLDGSRNIEVSIPTGTIFGIYNCAAGTVPAALADAGTLPCVVLSYGQPCAVSASSRPPPYSMVAKHPLVLRSACCSTRLSV